MKTQLIGQSKAIVKIRDLIKHVANTGLNTIITGESGVGKEVVARSLYEASPRMAKPFVKINCAALPNGLLESELFGFEKGAFTGADHRTRGKFELAHQGVLFLDEIGDMSIRLQAKLLHVLQSGEFSPLGSEKEIKSDCWVITATNQRLEKNVSKKIFREDLYYRLNIINIDIPPLRERPEDIPPLINYYFQRYVTQFESRTLKKPKPYIVAQFCEYPWPGNVRELQNTLKRYIVLEDWDEILSGLSHEFNRHGDCSKIKKVNHTENVVERYLLNFDGDRLRPGVDFSLKKAKKMVVDDIEKKIIAHVLEKTGWNRTKATKILKISYKTLLNKISELDLAPPKNSEKQTF